MKQELAFWPHWEAIGLNLRSRRERERGKEVRVCGYGGGGLRW